MEELQTAYLKLDAATKRQFLRWAQQPAAAAAAQQCPSSLTTHEGAQAAGQRDVQLSDADVLERIFTWCQHTHTHSSNPQTHPTPTRLSAPQLCIAAQVCRQYRGIASSEAIWQARTAVDYVWEIGGTALTPLLMVHSWRTVFKELSAHFGTTSMIHGAEDDIEEVIDLCLGEDAEQAVRRFLMGVCQVRVRVRVRG